MKEDEMGSECGTYGRNKNVYRVFLGNLKERDLF